MITTFAKRIITFVFLTAMIAGCTSHMAPTEPSPCASGACTPTITATNTPFFTPTCTSTVSAVFTGIGKIDSADMQVVIMSMTITASSDYFYDNSGKIQKIQSYGLAGSEDYSYNSSGLVSRISMDPAKYTDYSYNIAGRLTSTTQVDGGANTILVYYYDGSNLINRMDEYDNGVYTSYRTITRDGTGFITREDFFGTSGIPNGNYNTYVRNDALKTITMNAYIIGMLWFTMVFTYDTGGFLNNMSYTLEMMGTVYATINVDFNLINALFDPGGIHGYYYTDKDLYPMVFEYFTSSI